MESKSPFDTTDKFFIACPHCKRSVEVTEEKRKTKQRLKAEVEKILDEFMNICKSPNHVSQGWIPITTLDYRFEELKKRLGII